MNELEKLMKRAEELEKLAERSKDQEGELKTAKVRILALEKERKDEATKTTARLAEMERKEAIREAGEQYGADAETIRTFVADSSKSLQDFKDGLLAKRVSDAPNVPTNVMSEDGRKDMLRAIEDSLVIRLGGAVKDAHKDMANYRGATLIDLARAITGDTGYDNEKIAQRAMVTADFPNLLLGAGNRVLMAEFEMAASTYKAFVTEIDVPDFRVNTDITRGGGGRLDKVKESGELKEKNLGEAAEKWAIESYGNKFVLTRKMIINDDLGAFTDMLAMFGEMASLTANGLVYDLLLKRGDSASYVMSDGNAIFDNANHKNKANTALDATSLSTGRVAMRKHKGIDGKTALNIAPAYLIVGPDLEQTAYELVNSIAKIEDNKSSGVVNYHQGSVTVIVDAEITDASWFLSAARRGIKVGYLSGTGRRPVLKMNESTLTKTEFEGVFDIGVVASDYKGLYQGK